MSQYHIKNDILISPILSCEANVYKIWWIYLGGKKKYEYNNFFWVFGIYQKIKISLGVWAWIQPCTWGKTGLNLGYGLTN